MVDDGQECRGKGRQAGDHACRGWQDPHDELFAIRAGNDRLFAMGMMSASFLSKMVCDYVGREHLRTFRVRFTSRIWPGDTVICSGKVTRKQATNGEQLIEGEMQAANQRGEVTILGTFSAALPSKSP